MHRKVHDTFDTGCMYMHVWMFAEVCAGCFMYSVCGLRCVCGPYCKSVWKITKRWDGQHSTFPLWKADGARLVFWCLLPSYVSKCRSWVWGRNLIFHRAQGFKLIWAQPNLVSTSTETEHKWHLVDRSGTAPLTMRISEGRGRWRPCSLSPLLMSVSHDWSNRSYLLKYPLFCFITLNFKVDVYWCLRLIVA